MWKVSLVKKKEAEDEYAGQASERNETENEINQELNESMRR
jgi:hypothetical protein